MAEEDDRLAAELSLLDAIYPDQVQYHEKGREVSYRTESGSFQLRLPDEYLASALPEVLSASAGKTDLRGKLKQRISEYDTGEEVLDSIVLAFNEIAEAAEASSEARKQADGAHAGDHEGKATIIVWLHHLLNTNKRKQALSPSSPDVSGVTKPGYPGVLLYSGPAKAVHEHVNELKQQNWQAFQVRLESDEEWTFAHGKGVKEVEAMKGVVAEVGDVQKETFMEAMRMK
ncbi:hypothetical protein LTR36_008775 [Oleoguttula mirabilis]|uniref:RWD domain-containing protein n=1 Tax=Oleoguttula mirabilis TaxID=1507867 RepID=A0AAV9JV98_9PEZI|nr:hypothetical protein LTR36_008775 [Oleoguttula mirabilis]